MAEFKVVIGDPKTGKSHQIAVSGDNAKTLLGRKLGDKFKGEALDMPGYEFEITGGADYCGFPMRKDIDGPVRKKILIVSGVGTRNKEKGIRTRKTVCGNTIHENITQVSVKVLKYGKKPLGPEEAKPEEPAKEEKPAKAEKPAKEEKPVEKPAKEEKPAGKPAEDAKVQEEPQVKEAAKPKAAKEEKPAKAVKPVKEEKPAAEKKEKAAKS